MLYEGWVIHLMWGWFVTYTFGVIQPNVLTCVGLSALNSLLFPSAIPSTDTSPEKAFDAILGIFAKVTVVLVTGFVLHFFI
jgi:hypothetical protein